MELSLEDIKSERKGKISIIKARDRSVPIVIMIGKKCFKKLTQKHSKNVLYGLGIRSAIREPCAPRRVASC